MSALPIDWPSPDHDVGAHGAGRRHEAERHGLGEHRDQQRAVLVRLLGDRRADRAGLPKTSGVCTTTQERCRRSASRVLAPCTSGGRATTSSLAMRERVSPRRRSADAGRPRAPALRRLVTRCAISTASPVPVEPSYMEAFATSMPVSAATWVWNSNRILQRALRDLGLVGRVAGQELRALDQVIDGRRHMVLVGAGADEERHRRGRRRSGGHASEDALDLELALAARQVERLRRSSLSSARRRTGRRYRRRRSGRASRRGRCRQEADSASAILGSGAAPTTTSVCTELAMKHPRGEVMQWHPSGRAWRPRTIAGPGHLGDEELARSFLVITPTASSS